MTENLFTYLLAMSFQSLNPATEEVIATYAEHDATEVERRLQCAQDCFVTWRETSSAERARLMKTLGQRFRDQKRELGELITKEMGRPIVAAVAEAEKCAWACDYYADHAETFLTPELIDAGLQESYVRFDPIGVVLAVMPWNFPLWQVMRFAAPALMAGNVGVLKHASSVQGCAFALEKLFLEAGFPEGAFQNLAIRASEVERVMRDDRVKGAALTGSEKAGASVASIAGEEIKRTVLELGGSDPFLVLADADLDRCVATAVTARLQNAGQSCIAAKRFIVEAAISEAFLQKLSEKYAAVVMGDPMDEKTIMGPMASARGREELASQVDRSVAMGARVVTGGVMATGPGYFYPPTILTNVKPGMPAYEEELFGPVASLIVVQDVEEAIRVANQSRFGLGSVVWTQDLMRAKEVARRLEAGFVAINGMVKSDPRLPFGGTKKSGYGRELSQYGIREFVNLKTVTVGS